MTQNSSASVMVISDADTDPPSVGTFWGAPATYGAPILTALGAVVLPLSLTDKDGLADLIDWVVSGWWTLAGLVAVLGGTLWTIVAAQKRTDVTKDLREALKAEQERHNVTRETAKDEAAADLTHVLSPVMHDIGNLAVSMSIGHGRDLVNRALGIVTKLVDVPHVRACLYRLDRVEDGQADREDIPNSLDLRSPHEGRQDRPRQSFVRGQSQVDDDFFEVLDRDKSRLVPNVDDPDVTVDCDGKVYKTFMNVPVKFKTQEFGVLSVDAPVAGSLKQSHVLLAGMVAQLMAIGINREKYRKRDRDPDAPTMPDTPPPAAESLAT